MGERPALEHPQRQLHVRATEHRPRQLDRQLRTGRPVGSRVEVRPGDIRYRPGFRPRMSRTVLNGRKLGPARVSSRRFATVRYPGGIFESYRWSNLYKAS